MGKPYQNNRIYTKKHWQWRRKRGAEGEIDPSDIIQGGQKYNFAPPQPY